MNVKRAPFDNVNVRRAISYGMDRRAYIKTVAQGGATPGPSMLPKPFGFWGLAERDLATLPGYGKPGENKALARKLLAEAGYGPQNPLRVEMATRAIPTYIDFASFVVAELKAVGVEAALKQVETAQWHPMVTRKDYQMGANVTGLGVDDPDANFYENYACDSPRNYTGYCDEHRDEDDRRAVPGARRAETGRARGADPAQARGGCRAAGHGLAPRLLPDGALREEPGPAQQHLQLRTDAGECGWGRLTTWGLRAPPCLPASAATAKLTNEMGGSGAPQAPQRARRRQSRPMRWGAPGAPKPPSERGDGKAAVALE